MSETEEIITKSSLILPILILTVVPLLFIVGATMVSEVVSFFNPCMIWGTDGGGSVTVSTSGICAGMVTSTSETMIQALSRLLLIQGGMIIGVALGIFAVWMGSSKLAAVGATILIAESIPTIFDGLFIFVLLPAAFLMWIAASRKIEAPRVN